MHSHSIREQQFLDLFSEYGLSPLILNESTHFDGKNLDNTLCDLHAVPLSLKIMGTKDISDHYPIILNLENAVQPNSSRMVFSFTSHDEMEVFEKSWIHFTYESYPSRANAVEFYNYLCYSIEFSFSGKRKKPLANPFYYTSNTMHTLNKLNTAKRKTVKSLSKTNIESVEKFQVEFSTSAELDGMLFVAGASMNTLHDCSSLLKSLKSNT